MVVFGFFAVAGEGIHHGGTEGTEKKRQELRVKSREPEVRSKVKFGGHGEERNANIR
jgi:hypothetical protein